MPSLRLPFRARVPALLAPAPVAALACVATLAACGSRTGIDVAGGVVAARDAAMRDVMVPPPPLDCAEAGLTYIYLIAQNNDLYSFYPSAGTFTRIGAIACPTTDPTDSPFSMAVDHEGVAYVVFNSGNLFRVSTKTSACEATPYVPVQLGYQTFGMGFVATPLDDGGTGETLYVAPDPTSASNLPPILATIDLTTFTLKEVAPFGNVGGVQVSQAELTGTGGGQLYGFFAANNNLPPSQIVQIDLQNATLTSDVLLPNVTQGSAWAFGFWGGDFYTFTAPTGTQSVVTRYRPSDGSVTQVATAPLGVLIVGAGVSTCAPQQ